MGIYTEAVQKLYVAYFSRPADPAGLTYWEGVVAAANGSTAAVSAAFAASAEYKASFAGMTEYQIVNTIYMNLFGRAAEPAGLQFWGQNLIAGKITIDAVVTAVASGAQGTDLVAYNSKVAAATAFTAALDTTPEILGYTGAGPNAAAVNFLAGVKDAATLAAAIAPATLAATVLAITSPPVVGVTTTLTEGIDTFVGTTANDTIIATTSDGVMALTTFDNINAGGGTDTLSFVDTATGNAGTLSLPTDATVAGIELMTVLTNGSVNLNTTSYTGLQKVTAVATGTSAASITASGTTDVELKSSTTGTTTIAGGKSVVASVGAAAGAVTVTGAALTTVAVTGGVNTTVTNTGTAANTLTAVSLTGTSGTAALTGKALTTVNLSKIVAAEAVTVSNSTAGHALNLNLAATGYTSAGATVAVSVADAVATSLNVATASKSNVAVTGGLIAAATLTGAGALTLDVAGQAKLKTIDGSAATGDLTLTGLTSVVKTVTTGTGSDTLTISTATVKDDAATTAVDETLTATVTTGAGDDDITVMTSGTGKTVIDAGAGDDVVQIDARGTTLQVLLGDGDDTLDASVAITAVDTIDAGAGSDTLALRLVGAANIGAFAGFDLFDAADLAKTLDVDILATKNTVSEIIVSGDVGAAAALTNVGAGVGVRATGDSASVLTLTQKTAGAMSITVDVDQDVDAEEDAAADTAMANFEVTNATTLNVTFDSDFVADIDDDIAGDNLVTLNLEGDAATAVTVNSGGDNASNELFYNDSANKLVTLTVTGAQALELDVASTKLATIDASAHTGGLTVSTDSLGNGGVVKLGSGVDLVGVGADSIVTGMEMVSGMEKALAVSVSVAAGDATAKAAAIADADMLMIAGATVADSAGGVFTGGTIAKGVLTFIGAGPATLTDAFAIANAAAETAGEAVVFNYLSNSYVFVQGATDLAVQLVGVTGITNFVEGGTDTFFIV